MNGLSPVLWFHVAHTKTEWNSLGLSQPDRFQLHEISHAFQATTKMIQRLRAAGVPSCFVDEVVGTSVQCVVHV